MRRMRRLFVPRGQTNLWLVRHSSVPQTLLHSYSSSRVPEEVNHACHGHDRLRRGDPGSLSYLRTVDYSDAFLVAVDRGLAVMAEVGLTPDLFVGDGDSVVPELLVGLDRSRTRVVILPARKDVSDLEAAFDLLVTMGRQGSVLVLAGLGGRLDHCLF